MAVRNANHMLSVQPIQFKQFRPYQELLQKSTMYLITIVMNPSIAPRSSPCVWSNNHMSQHSHNPQTIC